MRFVAVWIVPWARLGATDERPVEALLESAKSKLYDAFSAQLPHRSWDGLQYGPRIGGCRVVVVMQRCW